MADSDLIRSLRVAVADSFTLYLTAHAAHWNVEGPQFASLHEFFGDLYEDVFGAIDHFAESIRQHQEFAPSVFSDALEPATFKGASLDSGDPSTLVMALLSENRDMMETLKEVRQAADAAGDEGLANFCQERLGMHLKHDWQLRSLAK